MSTRFYLPSTGAAVVSPAYAAEWEDTFIASRLACVTSRIASPMSTVTFYDHVIPLPGDQDILFRQYVSAPIDAQTITAQTIKLQMRARQNVSWQVMVAALVVKVVSNDGSTVRGTILPLTRDDTILDAQSLTNRSMSPTTTQVVAQANDRVVIEVGVGGGNPGGHQSAISVGDDDASDLPEDNIEIQPFNPWLEFTQSLTFAAAEEYSRSFAEAMTLSPIPGTTYSAVRALTDSVAAADSITNIKSMFSTLVESLSLGDTITKIKGMYSTLTETLGLSDLINTPRAKVFLESMGLNVTMGIGEFFSAILTETITVSDSILRSMARIATETISAADSTLREVVKVITDSLTPGDSINYGRYLTLSDSLTGDDISLSKSPDKTLTEEQAISATVSKSTETSKSDSLSASDGLVVSGILVLIESLSLAGSIAKSAQRLLADSVSLSDILMGVPGRVLRILPWMKQPLIIRSEVHGLYSIASNIRGGGTEL